MNAAVKYEDYDLVAHQVQKLTERIKNLEATLARYEEFQFPAPSAPSEFALECRKRLLTLRSPWRVYPYETTNTSFNGKHYWLRAAPNPSEDVFLICKSGRNWGVLRSKDSIIQWLGNLEGSCMQE